MHSLWVTRPLPLLGRATSKPYWELRSKISNFICLQRLFLEQRMVWSLAIFRFHKTHAVTLISNKPFSLTRAIASGRGREWEWTRGNE